MAPVIRRPSTPAPAAKRPVTRPKARRVPTPSPTTANAAMPAVDLSQRLSWEYVDITDIQPYPFNPRDNAGAIDSVAESIKLVGFVIPCVIDADGVLVAGHTRVEAAKKLGMTEVPCLRASHLNREQLNAFRLIDNKVSEASKWDFDLLAGEIGKLSGLGLDYTKFGWQQEEIDCFSETVAEHCLTESVIIPEADQAAVSQRRAPTQARVVIGEIVFFLPAAAYRSWADGIRQLHEFNEDAIAADIKRRLGVLE